MSGFTRSVGTREPSERGRVTTVRLKEVASRGQPSVLGSAPSVLRKSRHLHSTPLTNVWLETTTGCTWAKPSSRRQGVCHRTFSVAQVEAAAQRISEFSHCREKPKCASVLRSRRPRHCDNRARASLVLARDSSSDIPRPACMSSSPC